MEFGTVMRLDSNLCPLRRYWGTGGGNALLIHENNVLQTSLTNVGVHISQLCLTVDEVPPAKAKSNSGKGLRLPPFFKPGWSWLIFHFTSPLLK